METGKTLQVHKTAGRAIRFRFNRLKAKIYTYRDVLLGYYIAIVKVWDVGEFGHSDVRYALMALPYDIYDYLQRRPKPDADVAQRLLVVASLALAEGTVEVLEEEVYLAYADAILIYFKRADHVYAVKSGKVYDLGPRAEAAWRAESYFSDSVVDVVRQFIREVSKV